MPRHRRSHHSSPPRVEPREQPRTLSSHSTYRGKQNNDSLNYPHGCGMARTRTSQQYEGRIPKTHREHLFAPYIPGAPPLWGCRNFKNIIYGSTLTGVVSVESNHPHRASKYRRGQPATPWRGTDSRGKYIEQSQRLKLTQPLSHPTSTTRAASGATPTSTSYCFMPHTLLWHRTIFADFPRMLYESRPIRHHGTFCAPSAFPLMIKSQ